jgi:hypothetical protein
MSALSDDYTKNFSKERKAIFNKRFSEDYDAAMSERSNIIRILGEMRELGLAEGGRIGLKEGLGSFETNDPREAMKEIIKRFVNVEGATVPISENISLNLGPSIDQAELGGIINLLGGDLMFGGSLKGDDKGDMLIKFKKEFNKGGRVAYQDGTPERKNYETPVTDVIKSVNNKTMDLASQAVEAFDKYSGIDQITSSNFPGMNDSAIGAPSDFRHQAAANALAEALGKGKVGPVGYLSGGIGSFGLGTIKEIGDLFAGLVDKNTTAKDAFSQAYEDTISNFKGAFAPTGTTSEDLYAELMKDYVPNNRFDMMPFRSRSFLTQKQKEFINKNRKDKNIIPKKKPTNVVTGTTKPGTGGGGDGKYGLGSDGQQSYDTGQGFGASATTGGPVSNRTGRGRTDYTLGGLARMLGE